MKADPVASWMRITVYYDTPRNRPPQVRSVRYDCRCGWQHEGVRGTSHREIAAQHAADHVHDSDR